MKGLYLTVLAIGLSVTQTALARRGSDREGFNFGLGLRAMSDNDRTKGAGKDNNSSRTTSSQAVTPHVGYVVMETVNIGLAGFFEDERSKEEFTSKDGSQRIDRETDSTVKGGSLFLRFHFASYMHFEAGMGIYDRRIKVSDEYTTREKNGSFSGERDEYTVRGIGPGYHVGAGLEVPVTQGFFFSTNYLLRSMQLRDHKGTGSIGEKRAHVETRELIFGLTHYLD